MKIIIDADAEGVGVEYLHDAGAAAGEIPGRPGRYIMSTTIAEAKVVLRVKDA